MIEIMAILAVLGLCFGSFVNAVVWRTRQQAKSSKLKAQSQKEYSILSGRSQCSNCHHKLAVKDLIPVMSWLLLRARCRYCHKKISAQYPIVEILAALTFTGSYLLWPEPLSGGQWLLLITWLASSVGLLALAVYDMYWMLLPNRILYPTFFAALAGQLSYVLFYASDKTHHLWLLALSLLVASGLFGLIYALSKGQWIGFGDVRLGLVTGSLLATPAKAFLMIFTASILGLLFVLPALITGRKKLAAKVPFGPFLIAATALIVLFGQPILDWYQQLLV